MIDFDGNQLIRGELIMKNGELIVIKLKYHTNSSLLEFLARLSGRYFCAIFKFSQISQNNICCFYLIQ